MKILKNEKADLDVAIIEYRDAFDEAVKEGTDIIVSNNCRGCSPDYVSVRDVKELAKKPKIVTFAQDCVDTDVMYIAAMAREGTLMLLFREDKYDLKNMSREELVQVSADQYRNILRDVAIETILNTSKVYSESVGDYLRSVKQNIETCIIQQLREGVINFIDNMSVYDGIPGATKEDSLIKDGYAVFEHIQGKGTILRTGEKVSGKAIMERNYFSYEFLERTCAIYVLERLGFDISYSGTIAINIDGSVTAKQGYYGNNVDTTYVEGIGGNVLYSLHFSSEKRDGLIKKLEPLISEIEGAEKTARDIINR